MPFPGNDAGQADLIHDLVVNDHTQIEDEPLLLAIYFSSQDVPNEECVFEVIRNFGYDEVSEDHRIFQIQFGRTPNFPLPEGDRLRLFLTNPVELRQAARENWPEVQDLRRAIARGPAGYELVYRRAGDDTADELLQSLCMPLAVA
jgi:hypothetical protein